MAGSGQSRELLNGYCGKLSCKTRPGGRSVASGFLPASVYYLPTFPVNECGSLGFVATVVVVIVVLWLWGGWGSASLVAKKGCCSLLLLLLLPWCSRWWLWHVQHNVHDLWGEASQLSQF